MADFEPPPTQREQISGVIASADIADVEAAGFEDPVEIGHGGFGMVYRCRQPLLDRTVAIKVLTAELDPENMDRFVREQQAMGRLSGHPHIANVLQVGATGSGRPYIVMQYHRHGSLESRIRRDGPLGLAGALSIGVKLAGALETAHSAGILHRDVKPANVLLTEYGEPQLTDFGIARIAGAFVTTTGTIAGSPAFTAPEVLKGQAASRFSDVYSLGATLFCAITGHAAFERRSGEKVVAQFLRVTSEPVPDLRQQGVAAEVAAAIEHAMADQPEERPATAAEFGEELRHAQRNTGMHVDDMALRSDTLSMEHRDDQDSLGGVPRRREAAPDSPAPLKRGARNPSIETLPPESGAIHRGEGRLPLNLTSFVGRRHETTEARGLLSASRLVTLTGIGGVGKSRLALRVAEDSRRVFHDGAWLVELGELKEADLLVETVSVALGLRDRSARPPFVVLAEQLADKQLLLILDNCEHLVDAVAPFAEALLRTCSSLRILATSRESLGVRGEITMRVPPLAVPDQDLPASLNETSRYDAIALFAQRAASVVPGFALTEDNWVSVARICQRLEGLPLPIELAAARLRALSADQILQRLSDRFRLLTGGNRDVPTRQQTLRLCIDWSHDLCSVAEQQLWARLAVFASTFDLDAVEGICTGEVMKDDVLDLIASLIDKSILIREEAGSAVRFRLLNTLRDYGREKLQESGEYAQFRRRHRDWYGELAFRAKSDWVGPQQLAWLTRLDSEQPNLRDAMEFCITEPGEAQTGIKIANAVYTLWRSRGLFSEGRHWFNRILSCQGAQLTAERVEALCSDSMLAGLQSDLSASTALTAEARTAAEELGDTVTSALVTCAEGYLDIFRGDLPRAVPRFKEAIEVFRENAVPALNETVALAGLAYAVGQLGDTTQALATYREMTALTDPQGEAFWKAESLVGLSLAMWQQGDSQRATNLAEDALRAALTVKDLFSCAWCLEVMAWTAADKNRTQRAAQLLGAADTLFCTTGSATAAFPSLPIHHDECQRRVRSSLGERASDAALQRGRELSLEEAAALALDEKQQASAPSVPKASSILTPREQQIAELVAQGLTNKAIADRLVISQRTAAGHVEHVLTKLGFASRTQIAAWVVEQGQQAPTASHPDSP
ncbi:protein kinase [Rhodococcus koreensis]|uniref:protein kinase domain-containing protein n=1 Tax=Rhodococcus koreensis TaxID=99653 RepID=UPI00366DE17B